MKLKNNVFYWSILLLLHPLALSPFVLRIAIVWAQDTEANGEIPQSWITSAEIDWKAIDEFINRINTRPTPEFPRVRDNVLPFKLSDLAGNVVSSSDTRFKDKIVLMDIWGTSCGICLTEMPTLVELYKKYRNHGFEIVSIAFESGPIEEHIPRLTEISKKLEIPFAFLYGGAITDVTKQLQNLLDFRGFPTRYFIGRDGKVLHAKIGADSLMSETLEETTTRLLGLPPPPTPIPDPATVENPDDREFSGVGIRIVLYSERRLLMVTEPIQGGPAARFGLKPGDVITEIDGESTNGISMEQVMNKIKGPVGTSVQLRVIRTGEPDPLTFDLVREVIKT